MNWNYRLGTRGSWERGLKTRLRNLGLVELSRTRSNGEVKTREKTVRQFAEIQQARIQRLCSFSTAIVLPRDVNQVARRWCVTPSFQLSRWAGWLPWMSCSWRWKQKPEVGQPRPALVQRGRTRNIRPIPAFPGTLNSRILFTEVQIITENWTGVPENIFKSVKYYKLMFQLIFFSTCILLAIFP